MLIRKINSYLQMDFFQPVLNKVHTIYMLVSFEMFKYTIRILKLIESKIWKLGNVFLTFSGRREVDKETYLFFN
jgi:hypothetical protein